MGACSRTSCLGPRLEVLLKKAPRFLEHVDPVFISIKVVIDLLVFEVLDSRLRTQESLRHAVAVLHVDIQIILAVTTLALPITRSIVMAMGRSRCAEWGMNETRCPSGESDMPRTPAIVPKAFAASATSSGEAETAAPRTSRSIDVSTPARSNRKESASLLRIASHLPLLHPLLKEAN